MKIISGAVGLWLRLRVLVVVVALLTAWFSGSALANTDIMSAQAYEKAVDLLRSVEILPSGDLPGDEFLNRGQFAVMLSNATGIKDWVFDSAPVFTDTTPGTDVHSAANYLAQMGIARGTTSTTFSPDQYLTYAQAILMIVNGLGYRVKAENTGGYPLGYIAVATEIGLLKELNIQYDFVAKRDGLVKLIYNALFIDLAKITSIGTEVFYTTEAGVNLLSERLGIHQIKGQITANHVTHLVASNGLGKGKMKIDDEIYNTGNTNADTLLGYNVNCYYSSENGINTIVHIIKQENVQELILYSSEIEDFIDRNYIYSKGRSVGSATISMGSFIIYNGKHMAYDEILMKPTNGSVKLIKSLGSEYDIVIISQSTDFIVQDISVEDLMVYGKYGVPPLNLDQQSRPHVTIRNTSGNIVDFTTLKEWNLLSVCTSLDGQYAEAIVSEQSVSGQVEAIEDLGEDTILIIEETEYVLSRTYPNTGDRKISAGAQGTFYLDVFNKIVAFDRHSVDRWKIGYLVKMGRESVMEPYRTKILSQTGKMIELDLNDRISLDGASVKNTDTAGLNSIATRQIIRYCLNNEEKITAIDTVVQGVNEGADSLSVTHPQSSFRFSTSQSSLNFQISLNDATRIFIVPTLPSIDEFDKYMVVSPEYFRGESNYDVEVYGTAENSIHAEMVVCVSDSDYPITKVRNIAIVDKIVLTLDPSEQEHERVYLGENGSVKTMFSASSDFLVKNGVKSGDIIRYSTDYRGYINKVEKIYDYENNTMKDDVNPYLDPSNADPGAFSDYRVLMGHVYSKGDEIIRVLKDTSPPAGLIPLADQYKYLENHYTKPYNMLLYDSTKQQDRLSKATFDDFLDYVNYNADCSRVAIQTRWGDARSIIIYK